MWQGAAVCVLATPPNGAAALKWAGKGGAPLRAAISRNTDRHARDTWFGQRSRARTSGRFGALSDMTL